MRRQAALWLTLLLLAACVQRPATENVARFSTALSETNDAVRMALGRVNAFERRIQREALAAAYVSPSERRDVPRFGTERPGVAAATLRFVVPTFELLDDYADRLAFLSGHEVLQPVSDATQNLADAIQSGVQVAQQAGVTIPSTALSTGLSGARALTAFIVEQRVARDIGNVVEAMHPEIEKLAAFLRAAIGLDSNTGVRGAMRDRRLQVDPLRREILGVAGRDRRIGTIERYDFFLRLSEARDADPSDSILTEILTVTEEMVNAHAALARPAALTTTAQVDSFIRAVRQLIQLYEDSRLS